MSIDELLQDAAPSGDDLRAVTTRIRPEVLARLDTPRNPRWFSRSRRALVIGGLSVVVAGGGLAYATSSFPRSFHAMINEMAAEYGDAGLASQMGQIVDLTLPDGSRFAAWEAVGNHSFCAVSQDNWDGSWQPGDPGRGDASCATSNVPRLDDVTVEVVAGRMERLPAAPKPTIIDHVRNRPEVWYPIIYGTTVTGATQVRVTGTLNWTGLATDLVLPISAATRSFAGVLPGEWRQWAFADPISSDPKIGADAIARGLTLTFLDPNGNVLEQRLVGPE